jgi:hypothetical protein
VVFLISASQIARIIGASHWLLAKHVFKSTASVLLNAEYDIFSQEQNYCIM